MFLFWNTVAISSSSLTLCVGVYTSILVFMCWLYTGNNPHGSAQTGILGAFTTSCLPRENQATVFLVRGYSVVIQEGESWHQEAQAAISSPPDCFTMVNLFEHPRLVEIKSVLWGHPWESWSTVYKLYFSFPGGNWELGFFVSSLCIGKERRYSISDHRLLSPFLFQAARLWWTHLSSKTVRTEVSSPVSPLGKVGSLDV